MRQERRRSPRVRVGHETYIEYGAERHAALIADLSQRGCFVLTPRHLSAGSLLRVEVGKRGLLHMSMEGVVAHHAVGRGVGVEFTGLTVTKQTMLTRLLLEASRAAPERAAHRLPDGPRP